MKLFVFWFLTSALSALETTQMGTCSSGPEYCPEEEPTLDRYNRSSSGQMQRIHDNEVAGDEEVSCFLYPEKMLRCTLPRQYLPTGSQVSASIITCDGEGDKRETSALPECLPEVTQPPEEPGEAKSVVKCLVDFHFSSVIVVLNVSGRDTHTVYCQTFSFKLLEVLSPPPNISVVVKKGLLLVSWGLPYTHTTALSSCFEYQLEVNQQVNEGKIEGQNHMEKAVDPAGGYAVRMRTKKKSTCIGSAEWSVWSDSIAVPPPGSHNLNYVVIVRILLGTPMIILPLLLLLRRLRVSKLLFPQIPQPPMKYKQFLKQHTSFHFLPVVQNAYEEDITVAEDTQR